MIHVDATHSDARAIVDGQAGVVDQGVAHSDAVEVQVTVESDGHLAVLVRTALGHADVAVATEGNVAIRADIGAVAVGVADVPAGRGQIGHALELRHVDGIGLLQTCGHTGDLASLSGSRIAYADGTQSALPGSAGIGGSQLRQRVEPRDTGSSIGDRACAKGNTVGDGSCRSVAQGDRVDSSGRNHRGVTDGNGTVGPRLGLGIVTNGESIGRRRSSLIANRRRIVAGRIRSVADRNRASPGRDGVRAHRRTEGATGSGRVTQCRTRSSARHGIRAHGRRVVARRGCRCSDGQGMVVRSA
ncbi:hypothetical protein D9M71_326670 [compost metagenome]